MMETPITAGAMAQQHNCILSYPEFSREAVLFETLSPKSKGWPTKCPFEVGRQEPGLRLRGDLKSMRRQRL